MAAWSPSRLPRTVFAIDTDRFVGPIRHCGRRPSGKRRPERDRIEAAHDIAQGIVGGNAVGQRQKAAQPRFPFLGKGLHPDPIFDPTEDRTQHNHQNILEWVKLVPGLAARIGQVGKIRAGVEQFGWHQFSPSDESRPVTRTIDLLSTPAHSAIALRGPGARLDPVPINP